jgi:ATP-binding cassette subfamily B protein
MDLIRVNAVFQPALVLLIGLSTIITIFIGGFKVMDGSITMGNIAEFVIYVNMLTWPVASLGWVVSIVQRASASQQRINEFLQTKPAVVSATTEPFPVTGEIEFRNVSYTYRNSGIRAVSGLSFRLHPGKSLAITGGTGSGKSTVAGLLLRLVDPDGGVVLVDGHDLRSVNLGAYRSQTGYVPQEVFLFSDTVAANIAFGLPGDLPAPERESRIRQAAAEAAVLDNILAFPEGFETRVGERGITLSGGQKQRISIARAIIRNPAILVFDDCLSAVDTRTEDRILEALQRIMKGKTTVIISHRISSVRHADHILVLDQGRLAEQGTHDSLIASGGIYKDMFEKQTLEPIQEE